MYLFDPDRGARRRRLIADQLVHAGHVAGDAAGTSGRDLSNRARGLVADTRSRLRGADADDRVIEERVRAELGRATSHPRAITVAVDQGRVTLSGAVLAREAESVVRRVRKVRGVVDVDDRLDVHETAENVPALQGDRMRAGGQFELSQENWTPAARLLTSVAGGALIAYAARRREPISAALGLAGVALLARGTTNTDLGRLTGIGGGRRAVNVQKTIDIGAPPEEVFRFLTGWESFPQWMTHVREVRASGPRGAIGERTHWVVDGPAGAPVAWDAETTRFERNRLVSWKSIEGSAVAHAGTLRVWPNETGGTRVHVQMTYNPPAGLVGHAVATFFGRDPKRQMDDDLARLKTTVETGIPPRDAAQPSAMPRTTGDASNRIPPEAEAGR
jgi:uncharacterized membrane protein